MFERIVEVICKGEGITPSEVIEDSRKTEVVYPRQLIMYFARELNLGSETRIGSLLGGRDHATVNHACKVIRNYIDTDKVKRVSIDAYARKFDLIGDVVTRIDSLNDEIKATEKSINELRNKVLNCNIDLLNIKEELKKIEEL